MQAIVADYKRAFKDADIRGIYPTELDEAVTYLIARAFVDQFKHKTVIVARDMRLSSPALHQAFVKGVNDAGANVLDIGLVHTPLLYYVSGTKKLPGVMITASHSPKNFNGLKLVFAGAIPLTEKNGLALIRKRIDKGTYLEVKKRGTYKEKDFKVAYQTFIFKKFNPKKYAGIKIVADAGNGMSNILLPLLKEKMPVSITTLFETLDGRFPNRASDPTLKKNQKAIKQYLKSHVVDFGVGFDGEGDRIAFHDEKGNYINSAIIGALIAQHLLKKQPKSKIVFTNLTSRILEETIIESGGKAVIARVGHAFIKEVMRKKDVLFGCEHSGHFYFKDYFFTDSVALTLLYVLDIYSEAKQKGVSFSELVRPFLKYYQNEDTIVDVKDREKAQKKTVAYLLSLKPKAVKEFDGLMVDYGDVWGSVKVSVTEYALKMMFESVDKKKAEALQKKVVAFTQSIAND